jgi:hypothetical protein
LDTDLCAHIYLNVQVLKNSVVVAIGDLDLYLFKRLILELSSIYFVPFIFKNIISVSYLDMDDFTFSIKDSFYRDDIFYGNS